MDGFHDLGGMDSFGPLNVELNEPVFHEAWERRAFGVTFASRLMELSNSGEFRHAIERMDPVHYLSSSYYEHWITSIATRLVETGRVDIDELERMAGGWFPLSFSVRAERIAEPGLDVPEPRFKVGSRVRVRDWHPLGHTRCPGYVRGKTGTVVRLDGSWSLPDVEAHCGERRMEPTYSVRFEADDLWGDGQSEAAVHVDLWDSYLEGS